MIEEPPILTLQRPKRRPSDAQIEAFQGVPTGFVVDAMGGGGVFDAQVSPLDPGRVKPVAGPAITADNGPGEVLASLGAIHLATPGDILVAAFDGFQGCAAAGDRVTGMAKNAGCVALVTDGPVRDFEGIQGVDLPVWCTGLTPNTPTGTGPGKVGLPVQIAGQQVATGDMIVADRDGVVVVPFAQIDAVIAHLETVRALETELDGRIADGFKEPIAELLATDQVKWV